MRVLFPEGRLGGLDDAYVLEYEAAKACGLEVGRMDMLNPPKHISELSLFRSYSVPPTKGALIVSSVELNRVRSHTFWQNALREWTAPTAYFHSWQDARLVSEVTGCDILCWKVPRVNRFTLGAIYYAIAKRDYWNKRRYFVMDRIPFAAEGDIPAPIHHAAKHIKNPFFAIDLATCAERENEVISVCDGQTATLDGWNVDHFYRAMVATLGRRIV